VTKVARQDQVVIRDEQRKRRDHMLCVRMAETGYQHIAKRAGESSVEVSEMVRRMLTYVAQQMPRETR
jgi:hypothetical protein